MSFETIELTKNPTRPPERPRRGALLRRSATGSKPLPSGPRHLPPARSAGMTLIELLVVIVLVTTLVTTAIPVISPGGDARKIREASRGLNAYLQGAQARAIETGRPFGVAFNRLSADTGRGEDNGVCVRVTLVEVPPPYAGFDEGSRCRIGRAANAASGLRQLGLEFINYGTAAANQNLPVGFQIDLVPDSFFRPGDTVIVGGRRFEFAAPNETIPLQGFGLSAPYTEQQADGVPGRIPGYLPGIAANQAAGAVSQRPRYALREVGLRTLVDTETGAARESGRQELAFTHDAQGNEINHESAARSDQDNDGVQQFWTAPRPYTVLRQPAPAAGEPFDLPAGAAIDLGASFFVGSGARLYEPQNRFLANEGANDAPDVLTDPVMILFSPKGTIHRAYAQTPDVQAGSDSDLLDGQTVTSSLAICVGRRELIGARPSEDYPYVDPDFTASRDVWANPIDANHPDLLLLPEVERAEVTDQYNWLNLDTRWVMINPQAGSVKTVAASSIVPAEAQIDANRALSFREQVLAATADARVGATAGGR